MPSTVGYAAPQLEQVTLDSLLQANKTELLEARDLGVGEPQIRQIRKRWPSPERKRLLEPTLLAQAAEPGGIELSRLDAQQVARSHRRQTLPPEQLP